MYWIEINLFTVYIYYEETLYVCVWGTHLGSVYGEVQAVLLPSDGAVAALSTHGALLLARQHPPPGDDGPGQLWGGGRGLWLPWGLGENVSWMTQLTRHKISPMNFSSREAGTLFWAFSASRYVKNNWGYLSFIALELYSLPQRPQVLALPKAIIKRQLKSRFVSFQLS